MLEFKEKYLFIFVQNFLLTKLRKYDIMEFRLAYVCGRAAKKIRGLAPSYFSSFSFSL